MSISVKTQLNKILFEKDGFIIASGSDKKVYKGTILQKPNELLNVDIEFKGEWKSYKNEMQFNFSEYIIKQEYSIYFLENMVTGLSKKAIADIKLKCPNNLEFIIENTPRELLKIKGIGEKLLEKIVKTFKENKHLKELAEFLLPFGITNNAIKKINETYGKSAIEVLKENPYKITDIRGISFKKADEIAIKIGLDPSSEFRITSGLEFSIRSYFDDNGHTCIDKETYFQCSKELLDNEKFELSYEVYNAFVKELIGFDTLRYVDAFEKILTLTSYYNMEKYLYDTFKHYKNVHHGCLYQNVDEIIAEQEKRAGYKLDQKQKDAVILVNSQYRIVYLEGYAGTGKSTSSKMSLDLYAKKYGEDSIAGCALSGIAAKRIETLTGYTSYTIHTLLGYRGGNDFEYNEENKLNYKIIMIDEASMIDTYLFYKLLKAVDLEETALLVVGDPAQLKAVAPGNIFENFISKKLAYGTKLEKVFRQNEDQIINVFATNYIRNGEVPQNYNDKYEDFEFVNQELNNSFKLKNSLPKNEYEALVQNNKEQIVENIKNIASKYTYSINYWKSDIWRYITEFQVISPMKGNILGSENLNIEIQKIFNPPIGGAEIEVYDKRFRFRDKVIHLKNENMKVLTTALYKQLTSEKNLKSAMTDDRIGRETKVFNGQLGVIININLEDDIISVFYPNENYIVLYKTNHFKQRTIDLSYAITIHKSQGSEYQNLVIPMTSSHYIMLNNNLLYTAITRAKNKLYLVGETFAFQRGCTNKQDVKRNTVMEHL